MSNQILIALPIMVGTSALTVPGRIDFATIGLPGVGLAQAYLWLRYL
jgi:hypothetical protein